MSSATSVRPLRYHSNNIAKNWNSSAFNFWLGAPGHRIPQIRRREKENANRMNVPRARGISGARMPLTVIVISELRVTLLKIRAKSRKPAPSLLFRPRLYHAPPGNIAIPTVPAFPDVESFMTRRLRLIQSSDLWRGKKAFQKFASHSRVQGLLYIFVGFGKSCMEGYANTSAHFVPFLPLPNWIFKNV